MAGNCRIGRLDDQLVRQLVEFGGGFIRPGGDRLDREARLAAALRSGAVGFGRRVALAMVIGETQPISVHEERRPHTSVAGPRHCSFRIGNTSRNSAVTTRTLIR